MPFTILYPDAKPQQLDIETKAVGDDVKLIHAQKDSFEAIERNVWETCDAIVVSRMPIDANVIPHLKRCRIIVRNGVGFDVRDLKGLGEAGIPACNIPDYGTTEVADSAIAMMLAFARGTAAMDAALRTDLPGNWTHERNVTARRLRGATFGVIGLGRIGTAAALRARAFGMNIMFYDPLLPGGTELGLGFTRARTLHELLGQADVIDIHTPLSAQTRKMINTEAVAAIKPGAYLINTARGALVDEPALVEALQSGRIAGAGLDVFAVEPLATTSPLCGLPNVVLSPHLAGSTVEAMEHMATMVAAQVVDVLSGRRPDHLVNPSVWIGGGASP